MERLCARGDEVVGVDNFDPFYPRATKEQNLARLRTVAAFAFVEGDIRDAAALAGAFGQARPDVVVHLAALAGVRPSLAEPARYADVNLVGTQRVIDAARARRRAAVRLRLVVVGLRARQPAAVQGVRPLPQAAVAIRVDQARRASSLLFAAHHLYGLDVTCLRFFTVYGPRQRPDLAIHKFGAADPRASRSRCSATAAAVRDYTFIDDIVDGVVASMDEAVAAPGISRLQPRRLADDDAARAGRSARPGARQEANRRMAARAAGRHEAHPGRRGTGARERSATPARCPSKRASPVSSPGSRA